MEASIAASPTQRQRRIHNRRVPLTDGRQGLRRIAKQLQHKSDAKVEALPEGFYVTFLCCVHEDRAGVARIVHEVIGKKEAVQFLEHHKEQLVAACTKHAGDGESDAAASEKYLEIPGNAEKRAEKLRDLLREAWREHVRGTAFENTKQMYRAVEKKGADPFPWWNEVTGGAPFVNTTVADPGISQKIYEYIGPKLYASAVGRTVDGSTEERESVREEVEAPVEKCLRNIWCINARGHRGKCRLRPPPSIVPADDPAPPPLLQECPSQEEQPRPVVEVTTIPSKSALLKLMKQKPPKPVKRKRKTKKPRRKQSAEDSKKKRVMNRRQSQAALSKVANMRKAGFAV